ncbi:phosphate ABC transporter permease subunit PstC [Ruegeria atlantica]|uniref:Phosphate transport system permease protein n=1 Tax=Ruegeria atlantica TaxID=81569 RepID=A0A0P1EET4_9RHOB|nr:phosphate ABC transporter permease subunit PstC [Ruegeria atlantica]CUH48449.1 Phosphate transport system permease protein PstC [Ruegeria atlantica]
MALSWLLLILLALAVIGFFAGRSRALASAGGNVRDLHSLPSYYGYNVALTALVPAVGVLIVWLLAQPMIVNSTVSSLIPDQAVPEGSERGLIMSEVRRVAYGLDGAVASGAMTETQAQNGNADIEALTKTLKDAGQVLTQDITQPILVAAQKFRSMTSTGTVAMQVVVLALALLGAAFAYLRTHKEFRARNVVEQGVLALLLLAASIAILTTIGIVLSMLFETMNFFQLHSWKDFFFGSTWAPNFRGGSELSILPLLWGTLYISVIALLVAVPIGLFAAIYLSEYASGVTRSVAKPLLEILAGIPTIVYGLFALLTVGPALVSMFGDGGALGVGWMASSNAVLTAGLVMGIMLIPFVSSLSDDIINAVPQSMRDGSLGLGATHSETVRNVILPAALPGIVGAILLAASRAIGETMIVVMAAGAIAKFSGNPFEAMTTITTRIVSQLTGDTDFASPETLVAFALGLTLFIITLGLNIFALYIVRKYREQYE